MWKIPRKKIGDLTYFFILSTAIHLIIYLLLNRYLPDLKSKISVSEPEKKLVVEFRPPASPSPQKAPTIETRKRKTKTLPTVKPIPQEKDFPKPAQSVEKSKEFKMFEEKLKGKMPADTVDTPKPEKIEEENTPEKKEFPIRTEELFVTRDRANEEAEKKIEAAPPPDWEKLISKFDKNLDVEKYVDPGFAGKGLLFFGDSEFNALWYGRIVKKRVVDGWFPPYAARVLGLTGRVIITFIIQKDGQIMNILLRDSSGNPALDDAALNAIKNADPMPALPKDYHYDSLAVMFSFWYNLKPPDVWDDFPD